jgi:prevent-host-death family protein
MRMSTEHQQYSVANQSAAIALYAAANGMGIVRSYVDAGKSGLSIQGRKALQELIRTVEAGEADFEYILVYDVSRWGRFLDADESAHYEYVCKRAGVHIRYCAEQFANDNTTTSNLLKALKRTMAGEFSRDLSKRVTAAQRRLFQMGYRQGGVAPFGFRRLLLDGTGQPKGILTAGQHKNLQTDKVILVYGPGDETKVVKEIFNLFTAGITEKKIAGTLNRRGLVTNLDRSWTSSAVHGLLTNLKYSGKDVYLRSSQSLTKKREWNPAEKWIVRPLAFPPMVTPKQFEKAQAIIRTRRHCGYSKEALLDDLRQLLALKGVLSAPLMKQHKLASQGVYIRKFGSVLRAFDLVGFKPKIDYRYVDVRRLQSKICARECEKLRNCLEAAKAQVQEEPGTNFLRVNGLLTIQLIVARCLLHSSKMWEVDLENTGRPDVLVVVRLDRDGELLDYFLLPTRDFSEKRLRFHTQNRLNDEVYRSPDVTAVVQCTARMSIAAGMTNVTAEIASMPVALNSGRRDATGSPRFHWHRVKEELLWAKIRRSRRLTSQVLVLLNALFQDDHFVTLLRAESFGLMPLCLLKRMTISQEPISVSIEVAAESYCQEALECTVACRFLELLVENTHVNRYLSKYHTEMLQAMQALLADEKNPPSNRTKEDALKPRIWTIPRARAGISELITQSQADGPQILTRNGRAKAVVISLPALKTLLRAKGKTPEPWMKERWWRP